MITVCNYRTRVEIMRENNSKIVKYYKALLTIATVGLSDKIQVTQLNQESVIFAICCMYYMEYTYTKKLIHSFPKTDLTN